MVVRHSPILNEILRATRISSASNNSTSLSQNISVLMLLFALPGIGRRRWESGSHSLGGISGPVAMKCLESDEQEKLGSQKYGPTRHWACTIFVEGIRCVPGRMRFDNRTEAAS